MAPDILNSGAKRNVNLTTLLLHHRGSSPLPHPQQSRSGRGSEGQQSLRSRQSKCDRSRDGQSLYKSNVYYCSVRGTVWHFVTRSFYTARSCQLPRPFSAIRCYLLDIFAATLHVWIPIKENVVCNC